MEPELRPIAAADDAEIEAVVRLWRRAREDAQPWLEERLGHTPADDRAFFRGALLATCEVTVAVAAGEPLGFLARKDDLVEHLYVDPARQGQGIGSRLLAHARERSPAGVRLFTHRRNLRARVFYERRGFRIVRFGVSPPPESEPDVLYRLGPG
ncbi:MAG: GNAT family N-acetyltransferase [Myxococcales bacterium]|nr:GNAT family N-acetyltransferase [Myxococcales bacterium]